MNLLRTTLILCFSTLCFLKGAFGIRQPVPYNHQVHVSMGIQCVSCHTGVETDPHATLPQTSTCRLCHWEGDKVNPRVKTPESLIQYLKTGEEIPWQRVYEVPKHVRFSHQLHVKSGVQSCTSCHGEMKDMSKPVEKQTVTIKMTQCMDCHQKKNVTLDCLACHK